MDLRILLRDENPDLMNGHLTGEVRAWYAEDRGRTTLEEILSLILQNAETIRLTGPEGDPISVARLHEGDEVLVCIEESGRHFGVKIEESIVEK